MTDEGRFEEFLQDKLRQSTAPPRVPRHEMWQQIEAARRERRVVHVDFWGSRKMLQFASAAAAILVLGIVIGRLWSPTATHTSVTEMASAVPEAPTSPALRLHAVRHLTQSEVLLTQFKARTTSAESDPEFARWARLLLTDTRLLLDSAVAADPEQRNLLVDLEYILVQIVRVSSGASDERQWVTQGLDHRGVMERIRLMTVSQPGAASM